VITTRRARPEDAAPLAAFAARLFHQTYDAFNTPENMRAYVAENFAPERVAAELGDPDIRVRLAEAEGRLAGYMYLRCGPAPECVPAAAPIELGRVYVDAPWQGRGLAARLLDESLREAREWGGDALWLAVWQRNERAIRFYRKHGFEVVGTQPFRLGEELQDDYLMARPLPGAA
jgi:diamine N-acetyltransferase